MLVYFVRHGESVEGSENKHQGPDTPLSALGRKQAKLLGQRLKNIDIDLIYTSPFARAEETAKIINKTLNVKMQYLEMVYEIKRPSRTEGQSFESEEVMRIRQMTFDNKHNPDWTYEDSESNRHLWERAGQTIDHLLKSHADDNILIASHGTFIRAFVARALFGPELDVKVLNTIVGKFSSENTGISLLRFTDEKGWRLMFWNDLRHIDDVNL